jgi:biopolymer transport protein ExbB
MKKLPVVLSLVALAFAASHAKADTSDLSTAYKRELAFLEAEKASLKTRLAESKAEEQQKLNVAKAEIERLQGRATGLSLEADRIQDMLADAESANAVQAESNDVLDSTLQQAEIALSKGGIKLPEGKADASPAERAQQLETAFRESLGLLRRYATVRTEQGSFFAEGGRKVDGSIVRLGQIAAFGVSDSAAGALAPAGEDRLKLWPLGNSAEVARALAAGSLPPSLNIFLYESLDKEVEKPHEKTWEDIMKAGGPIGWVIVAVGVIALLMAMARTALLARAAANTESLVKEIAPLVQSKNIDAALARVRAAKTSAGRVLDATLRSLHKPREQLEDVVSEAVLREQPTLDRFGSAILIAAAVGPLLGLLGTVTGMIATFDVITEYGNANPKLLAGGISEALVTTEFGLVVAIPALLIGNLLSGWAQGIKDDIDTAALRVTNIFFGNDVSARADSKERDPASPQLAPAE